MSRRLLDLFCGAGGCAVGYAKAGFEVVGVDVERQKYYPFEFIQADALEFPLDGFDVIHASPPCQRWSVATSHIRKQEDRLYSRYPDLLRPILKRFMELDIPWVVENVPGSPLHGAVIYCGSSFGLKVRRHRLFLSNVPLIAPPCSHASQGKVVGVYGNGGRRSDGKTVQVTGWEAAQALGIEHVKVHKHLSQCIPPAYTEHIGRQIMEHLDKGLPVENPDVWGNN